jgi:hypothetical protein
LLFQSLIKKMLLRFEISDNKKNLFWRIPEDPIVTRGVFALYRPDS